MICHIIYRLVWEQGLKKGAEFFASNTQGHLLLLE
jgi:hypothetical protein